MDAGLLYNHPSQHSVSSRQGKRPSISSDGSVEDSHFCACDGEGSTQCRQGAVKDSPYTSLFSAALYDTLNPNIANKYTSDGLSISPLAPKDRQTTLNNDQAIATLGNDQGRTASDNVLRISPRRVNQLKSVTSKLVITHLPGSGHICPSLEESQELFNVSVHRCFPPATSVLENCYSMGIEDAMRWLEQQQQQKSMR